MGSQIDHGDGVYSDLMTLVDANGDPLYSFEMTGTIEGEVTAGAYSTTVFGTLAAVTPGVIAAAGDYAAGDVLSGDADSGEGVAWVFDAMGRANAGSGTIVKAVLTASVDALVPRLRLWLFNANPSASELDDNAAFTIAAADRAKLVGYLDFPALADAGAISISQNLDIRMAYECAAADDALYGILQTLDAFTNESATMSITCALQSYQD